MNYKHFLMMAAVALPFSLSASNVQYKITDGLGTFSLTAPDFVPNLPPSVSFANSIEWHFNLSQLDSIPEVCAATSRTPCTDLFLALDFNEITLQPLDSRFRVDSYDPIDKVTYPIASYFFNTDLAQLGRFYYGPTTGPSLTVQYSDADVSYAPEPRAWELLGIGLVLCSFSFWRRKRVAAN